MYIYNCIMRKCDYLTRVSSYPILPHTIVNSEDSWKKKKQQKKKTCWRKCTFYAGLVCMD